MVTQTLSVGGASFCLDRNGIA